jgi:hypothetical protein
MSLNYELSKIENFEEVCYEPHPDGDGRRMKAVTHAIIMGTMTVGMGQITPETASTFYARMKAVEKLHGWWVVNGADGTGIPITPEDIRNHIGLRTNVGKESDAAWAKRIMSGALHEYRRQAE